MNEMTPETLRAFLRYNATHPTALAYSGVIEQHAAAWQADLEQLRLTIIHSVNRGGEDMTDMTPKSLRALKKDCSAWASLDAAASAWEADLARIEALERVGWRVLELDARSSTEEGHKRDIVTAMAELSKALAAKEKP